MACQVDKSLFFVRALGWVWGWEEGVDSTSQRARFDSRCGQLFLGQSVIAVDSFSMMEWVTTSLLPRAVVCVCACVAVWRDVHKF